MSNFEPKDLNFETIKNLFLECLPVQGKTKNISAVYLQQAASGFEKDSEPIYFDTDKLDENREFVRYLFGQLYAIHQGEIDIKLTDILKKYNGYLWCKDKAASIFLLHLGMGTKTISPPDANTGSFLVFGGTYPTLSPKDPRFNEWYKLYEEKVLRKKQGQEVADN